ncbi:MAG: rRNA maturation RNase YbeY [bacterium]
MIEINNTTRLAVDKKLIEFIATETLKYFDKNDCNLSIAFVSGSAIRRLNKKLRGIDKVTDILSYAGDGNDLGELIICYKQIIDQAPNFQQSAENELIFILVHGILHLLGHEDGVDSDRLKMMKLGAKIIKKISPRHTPSTDSIK